MLKEYLTNIADKLRDKLGTTNKIRAQDYVNKIDEVYEKGYSDNSGINPDWTNFRYFCYNNNRLDKVVRLKYNDTSKCTDFGYMYFGSGAMTKAPDIDTSKGTIFDYMYKDCGSIVTIPAHDFSKATRLYCTFEGCKFLTTVPEINSINCTNFGYMFSGCTKLQKISKINMSKAVTVGSMFSNTTSLTEIYFDGTINCNYINITSASSGLTHDSLMSLLNALADRSNESTQYTITIASKNINKLTEEEKSIATDKGWILK